MPRCYRKFLLSLTLLLGASSGRADVLVLVHGWASDAGTWYRSGVMTPLLATGWRDGGVLINGPAGVLLLPVQQAVTGNVIYRSELPEQAPLALQADLLGAQLAWISARHPDEAVSLVGHSAGAVVARMVLVTERAPRAETFVSIAAPNLGTPRAIDGLEVVDSKPFFCPGPGITMLKNFFAGDDYHYLRDSYPALVDLAPLTLTGWLNQQPHPNINYLAIIHDVPGGAGDELVPAFSQDLNQVPMLRGRVSVVALLSGHGLNPGDGTILARNLGNGNKKPGS